MKIIYISKFCHKTVSWSFPLLSVLAVLLMFNLVIGVGTMWLGYEYGRESQIVVSDPDQANLILKASLEQQQDLLADTRQTVRNHLDALALRLGELQSHILRLDALGEQLVEQGKLDPEEFNFSESPARGGLDEPSAMESVAVSDLVSDMEQVSQMLDDQEQRLGLLSDLLVSAKVHNEMSPQGKPVAKGWISSYYGKRKDPFSGKNAFHHGIDIAGKKDSEIMAVASGLVTWAGERSGFGYLVEIMHADGYSTKYAHNSKIFVKVGDLVSKGQVIGLMGSSGRSTGPHVHFEMSYNGKTINPLKYIKKKSS